MATSFVPSLLPKAKAARAGKVYGAPGDGYSGHISIIYGDEREGSKELAHV
jgi:hypothetical protein